MWKVVKAVVTCLRSPLILSIRRSSSSIAFYFWRRAHKVRRAALVTSGICASVAPLVMAKGVSGVNVQEIIEKADQLYHENKIREAYEYLHQYKDVDHADLQWRLARLCYHMSKYYSDNQAQAKQLAQEGLSYAERSIELDKDNAAAFRWMGISVSCESEFEGYKKKIEKSYEIRDHFKRAIELNPDNPTAYHLLGQWCFEVASVPWYMRKAASIIFATPPSATIEEALAHFEKAEKVEPEFYSTNWLFIGKCYQQMGNKEEARKWLQKAAGYECQDADDENAKKEAEELLAKL